MEIREILTRIGYVRDKADLSAREVSNLIEMSPQYVAKLESGNIVLTVEKLLDILRVCNFPIEKFFYSKPDDYDNDKELFDLIKLIPSEKKEYLINFIKNK